MAGVEAEPRPVRAADATALECLRRESDVLCCPGCGGELRIEAQRISCASCNREFGWSDHIPQLFWPNEWDASREDVTERMRSFYEQTPFPNYDDFDDVGSLIRKARQGVFAKLLDDQVPHGARVLECGCGTGQLSNFLSVANRTVFGTDLCLNSLRLGQRFKERNGLARVHFLQMNLFRPAFRPASFDLVISNGVLHHTSDPELGFATIAKLVKPGGHVLVGLYHRYGRLITDLRRAVFSLSGNRLTSLDPNLRGRRLSSGKWTAWFMDQYKNPHESKHTIGQVMRWVERAGLRFTKSIPHSKPFTPFSGQERLFEPEEPGNAVERALSELAMIPAGSREGGFFTVIARREAA
jgi:SAM-dependent methyltransferase